MNYNCTECTAGPCSIKFGVPIIVVGDHGQLPPVKGKFNLMENPIFKLEQIHRQAADNPIIKLSESWQVGYPVVTSIK